MRFWSVPPDLWQGRTVAIAAGGPSLNVEDIERCHDAGAAVIVISPAHQLAPWADLLFAAATHSWDDYPEMVNFAGIRICLWGARPLASNQEVMQKLAMQGVKVLRHINHHNGLSKNPDVLHGNNSIHQMINLSVLAGARKVVLLGADLRAHGEQLYWHAGHPKTRNMVSFPAQIKSIDTTVKPLAEAGVKVVNATPGSALKAFPIMPLSVALV